MPKFNRRYRRQEEIELRQYDEDLHQQQPAKSTEGRKSGYSEWVDAHINKILLSGLVGLVLSAGVAYATLAGSFR